MKILWLTWKDHLHPGAGGAEVVSRELSQRLAAEGHDITLLTCGYPGAAARERLDGVEIIRIGRSRYLHPFQAFGHYVRRLRNKYDIVIEEVNAAPYFGVFFGKRARRFLLYHHLEREVWLHEAKPPLSHLGYYVLEPLATRLLSRAGVPVITVSESSRQDLARYGFPHNNIHIISEGIEIDPVTDLYATPKFARPTMLSFGGIRAMKRTLDQVKAFERAKTIIPDLQLKIAGGANSAYGAKVLDYIKQSQFAQNIEYLGRVNREQKIKLMRRSHLIGVTSIKEGWGLIVTEANSQGTPAVVYDVKGLRDSVRHEETGLTTAPQPAALAEGIVNLLQDRTRYERLREAAWRWSHNINFDQSYKDFKRVVGLA